MILPDLENDEASNKPEIIQDDLNDAERELLNNIDATALDIETTDLSLDVDYQSLPDVWNVMYNKIYFYRFKKMYSFVI